MNEEKLIKIIGQSLVATEMPQICVRSGSTETYDLEPHTVFETSIVERLVRAAGENGEECVGWEVAYPFSDLPSSDGNAAQNNWRQSMLDFGLGYQERSYEDIGRHVFQFPVEVKRWAGPEQQPDPGAIWQDVYKLAGYWFPKASLSIHRYMLVVFKKGACSEARAKEIFELQPIERLGAKKILEGFRWYTESIDWATRRFKDNEKIVSVVGFWHDTPVGAALLKVNCT